MAADLKKLPAEKKTFSTGTVVLDDNAYSLQGRDSSEIPVQCHYESY